MRGRMIVPSAAPSSKLPSDHAASWCCAISINSPPDGCQHLLILRGSPLRKNKQDVRHRPGCISVPPPRRDRTITVRRWRSVLAGDRRARQMWIRQTYDWGLRLATLVAVWSSRFRQSVRTCQYPWSPFCTAGESKSPTCGARLAMGSA